MKIIKNTGFRVALYVVGLVCTILILASGAAEIIRFSEYPDDIKKDEWADTYEESETVKNKMLQAVTGVQSKVKTEQELFNLLSDEGTIEIYDYSDIEEGKAFNPEKDYSEEKYSDIIGTSNIVDSMSNYLSISDGYNYYGEVYYPDYPQNSRYIRIKWQDYKDIIIGI